MKGNHCAEANDGALLMVTSGTTASSKIAMLSHRTLLQSPSFETGAAPGRN